MNRPSRKTSLSPHKSLRFDPEALGLIELTRDFYRQETTDIARRLLGVWLARRHRGQWYGARIVETEAYLGCRDAAAHSHGGTGASLRAEREPSTRHDEGRAGEEAAR